MKCLRKGSLFVLLLFVTASPTGALISEKEFDELLVAVEASNVEKIKKILNKEKANAKDKHGQPLLHRVKDIRIARLFLVHGSDVNATDGYFETTALHKVSNPEFARLFIEFGADVNARNLYKQTPLHHVKSVGLAKLLVEKGADVNAIDDSGYTPLHVTSEITVATYLIDQGANVNAKTYDGSTPLHRVQDIRKIKLLIERGANINAQNNAGETVLHLAAKEGQTIHVDKIEAGHHAPSRTDWTENRKIIKLLVANRINPSLKNVKGETASDIARDKQIKALIKTAEKTLQGEKSK